MCGIYSKIWHVTIREIPKAIPGRPATLPLPWYGRQPDRHPVSAVPAEQIQRYEQSHWNKNDNYQVNEQIQYNKQSH